MKKRFQWAFAAAMIIQPSLAAATVCNTSYMYETPFWSMKGTYNPLKTTDGRVINKILLNVQTHPSGTGGTGCVGPVVLRKGLPSVMFNFPPSCGRSGSTDVGLFDDFIVSKDPITLIGRVPLSKQSATGNEQQNYDYRIIISNAVITSFCYADVRVNGISEFWDGRG